jgi:hypothetical protein
MIKCKGTDRYGRQCNLSNINNNGFCKFHEYLSEYTLEQLNNLKLCKCCNKWKYLQENNKTCDKCRNIGKENKIKYDNNKIVCKKDGCNFKKSIENDFCGKHQALYFKEQTELLSKKVCSNYIRGCREQLHNAYLFSRCSKCLNNDREKDKEKKNIIVEKINKNNENNENKTQIIINNIQTYIYKTEQKINKIISHLNCFKDDNNKFIKMNINTKLIKCSDIKCQLIYFEKYFISDTNSLTTKTCQTCRIKGKIKDNSDNRIKLKEKWKEENHDKISKYWMDYRGRKMEKFGDSYWEKNAEQAKNLRANNLDKVKEINKKKRENINYSYVTYINDSINKNLIFELTKEEFLEIVKKPCFYCNTIQDKGFNGIDKKICNNGYIMDNIVSCCKMCNVMKGTLTPEIFFRRIEHILTYQDIIKGKLDNNIFENYISVPYNKYKNRAINRLKINFEITEEDFIEIKKNDCYLCGKTNSKNHKNGIDRVDNNLGYIKTNIKSCCADCNYMKNKYNLEKILNKFALIYNNLKHYKFNDNIHIFKHKNNHLNKISSDEKNKLFKEKI